MKELNFTIKKPDVSNDEVVKRLLELEKQLVYFNEIEALKDSSKPGGKWVYDFKSSSNWEGAFERFKEYLSKKETIVLAAVKNKPLRIKESKRIIGFVTGDIIERIGSKISIGGDVSLLVVVKNYRSKNLGVGRKLMNAVLKEFKNKGINYVTVYAYANNHRAIRLYKSLGFVDLDHGFLIKL